MKTWAEIIADRLDEMGRIKDMGRPAILDTEREAAEIIRFMQRRIAELEKESVSLKKDARRLDFILDRVCIEAPVNSTYWYSLIGLDVSGDFYQREGSIRELFVSDVDETIKEFNA